MNRELKQWWEKEKENVEIHTTSTNRHWIMATHLPTGTTVEIDDDSIISLVELREKIWTKLYNAVKEKDHG